MCKNDSIRQPLPTRFLRHGEVKRCVTVTNNYNCWRACPSYNLSIFNYVCNIMKKIYTLFSIFILIVGCKNSIEKDKNCPHLLTHELVETEDVKKFHLPSHVLCYSIEMQVWEDPSKKELLYFLGKENSILVYDLSEEKLISEIKLQKDGPDAVGIATGFKVYTKDSILVTPKFSQNLFFINEAGRKIFTISYRDDKLKTSTTRCNHAVSIFSKDHLVYIPQFLEGNWNYLSTKEFEEYRNTLEIDSKTNIFKRVGLGLPFHSSEYKTKSQDYSVTEFENEYMYSFSGSDSIFITKDFKIFKSFLCASTNVTRPLANFLGTDDMQDIMKKQVQSCSYQNLVWDPYREVIYRFYQIGAKDLKNSDNLFDLKNFPQSFGIMVLDKDLNVIADQIMTSNKYFFNNFFVAKEGLYLSINHPSNQDMDYNYLSFELIKLKKK